jgi:hypothetical protein
MSSVTSVGEMMDAGKGPAGGVSCNAFGGPHLVKGEKILTRNRGVTLEAECGEGRYLPKSRWEAVRDIRVCQASVARQLSDPTA